ncbi:unnamed protein product, partial [Dicrocoelium dendriticum]
MLADAAFLYILLRASVSTFSVRREACHGWFRLLFSLYFVFFASNFRSLEFVASLLDALPAKSSSAWIGLRRNLSDESPQFHWADTDKVEFLRPVYHAQNVPVIHLAHIGNASTSDIDLTLLPQLCTALYRSTYPRLNGLWLQWSCEEAILLPSICQAVPPAGMDWDNVVRNTGSYECPTGFYLGTTGLSASAASLTGPVCYRLLSATVTFDWK